MRVLSSDAYNFTTSQCLWVVCNRLYTLVITSRTSRAHREGHGGDPQRVALGELAPLDGGKAVAAKEEVEAVEHKGRPHVDEVEGEVARVDDVLDEERQERRDEPVRTYRHHPRRQG